MFDTLFTQSVELCITNVLFSFHLETPSPNFYLSNRLYLTLPVWSQTIWRRYFQFTLCCLFLLESSSSLETLPKTISTKPTGNTIKVLLHTLKNNELSIPLLFLLSFYLSIYSFLCFFYFIFSHWLFFCPVLPPTVSSTAASPTIVVAKLKTGITFFVNVAHKNWI